jgi:hypothetical protein
VHPADHAAIERRRAELVQRREELIVKWHRLVARGGKGLQGSSRLSRAPLMAPMNFGVGHADFWRSDLWLGC